jgi:hypothetical protein
MACMQAGLLLGGVGFKSREDGDERGIHGIQISSQIDINESSVPNERNSLNYEKTEKLTI